MVIISQSPSKRRDPHSIARAAAQELEKKYPMVRFLNIVFHSATKFPVNYMNPSIASLQIIHGCERKETVRGEEGKEEWGRRVVEEKGVHSTHFNISRFVGIVSEKLSDGARLKDASPRHADW
jgi:hypothetical protein